MKKKIAYAVFTLTNSGLDYMVKGNFGSDKEKANSWKRDNELTSTDHTKSGFKAGFKYPHGLFVKEVKY